jgi:hypothetical protein
VEKEHQGGGMQEKKMMAAAEQRENREEEEREFSQGPVHKFRKYGDLGVKKNLTTVLEFK